jgi:hypothetical protein
MNFGDLNCAGFRKGLTFTEGRRDLASLSTTQLRMQGLIVTEWNGAANGD